MSELQWQSLYQAAFFETDDSQLHQRINAAEAAIQKRFQSDELEDVEADALTHAMNMLEILRKERLGSG